MFDGIAPMPWLKSASNWFPGTEEVQPDEIRVTFMGSPHCPAPARWAPRSTSSWVTAKFIFDMVPARSPTTWPRAYR